MNEGAFTFRTQTVPVLPGVREPLMTDRAEQPGILPDDQWMFPAPTYPG